MYLIYTLPSRICICWFFYLHIKIFPTQKPYVVPRLRGATSDLWRLCVSWLGNGTLILISHITAKFSHTCHTQRNVKLYIYIENMHMMITSRNSVIKRWICERNAGYLLRSVWFRLGPLLSTGPSSFMIPGPMNDKQVTIINNCIKKNWGREATSKKVYINTHQVFTTFLKLYLIIFATQNPKKKHGELFPKPLDSHHCLAPENVPPKQAILVLGARKVSIGRPWTRLLGQPALLFLTSVHGPEIHGPWLVVRFHFGFAWGSLT